MCLKIGMLTLAVPSWLKACLIFKWWRVLSCSLLLVVRVLVAAVSGSLSIIVTVLDAFLDVLSGGFLWLSSHYSRRKAPGQKYLYPVGRARMEPLGIIVFAVSGNWVKFPA